MVVYSEVLSADRFVWVLLIEWVVKTWKLLDAPCRDRIDLGSLKFTPSALSVYQVSGQMSWNFFRSAAEL